MFRYLLSAAPVLLLAACGGGGGNTPPPPPPANNAPTISSGGSAQLVENNVAAYQVQASDPDGDALTYSLSGGTDASLFAINASGSVTFNAPPDFELPGDTNRDNSYRVNVTVSDGQASAAINLTITVTNDREGIAVRRIATGFNEPTYIASIPGEAEVFVIERGGGIYKLNPNTGDFYLFRTAVRISTDGEGGLLGIAVSQSYLTNPFFYVFVTNQTGDIEIRQLLGFNRQLVGPLLIPHPGFDNHYGGWMGFGPDGYLYIATGDGGGSGDPNGNAQNSNSLLGKILRVQENLDPFAGASVPRNFVLIPPDNPFVGGGGAREVFALGLRNPFRASFSGTDLLIGDVGQNSFEEVDRLSTVNGGGTNFGWPFREGGSPFQGTPPNGLTDPITEYENGSGPRQGASVIGGAVYDGAIADLFGKYVFADFVSGNIWSVPTGALDDGSVLSSDNYERRNEDFEPDVGSIDQIVAIVRSDSGDLYIVDFDGDIFIVEAA